MSGLISEKSRSIVGRMAVPDAMSVARLGFVGFLILAPIFLTGTQLYIASITLVMGLLALSVWFLTFRVGDVSLGQALIFGGSAFAIAVSAQEGQSTSQSLVIALAVGMGLTILSGALVVRLEDDYFLMATLALAMIAWGLSIRWASVTGGQNGLSGVKRPGFAADTVSFHVLVAGCVVTLVGILFAILRSKTGLLFDGTYSNRVRMTSLGFRVATYRLLGFLVAGTIATVAGILFAYGQGFVSAGTLSLETSAGALVGAILGGMRHSIFAPFVGAGILSFVTNFVSDVTDQWPLILGLIYICGALLLLRVKESPRTEWSSRMRSAFVTVSSEAGSSSDDGHPGHADRPATPKRSASGRTRSASPAGGLSVQGVSKSFGGIHALDAVSLDVAAGECRSIIGPNGAGKTSLFRAIAGASQVDTGRLFLGSREVTRMSEMSRVRLGLARTFQDPEIFAELDVLSNLALAAHPLDISGGLASGGILDRIPLDLWEQLLEPQLATQVSELSYGQQRVLEICMAILRQPRWLLLDEPTAGLSPSDRAVVCSVVEQLKLSGDTTILLIDHDMDVALRVADSVTCLAEGRVIVTGSPEEIANHSGVQKVYLGSAHVGNS